MTRLVATDEAGLDAASAALAAGEVVAIPTDTVYGLAVDPTRSGGADRLFELKGRGRDIPIAVLVADAGQARGIIAGGALPAAVEERWPGALTVVVTCTPHWPGDLGDTGGTVGLRCPDDDWVRALCRRAGPLATTSANLHGQATPPDAGGVAVLFGDGVSVVVDGGRRTGVPSTVVDCTVDHPVVLRQGSLVWDA